MKDLENKIAGCITLAFALVIGVLVFAWGRTL